MTGVIVHGYRNERNLSILSMPVERSVSRVNRRTLVLDGAPELLNENIVQCAPPSIHANLDIFVE
jgi:hypothetical protein